MTEQKDYKLGVAILEAEVSKLTKDNKSLNVRLGIKTDQVEELGGEVKDLQEKLDFYEITIPTVYSMADMDKMQRLLKLVTTITDEQLNGLGV